MKKITFLFVLALIMACSSSSEEVLRSGNSITLFQLQINNGVVSGQINQTSNTIVFNVTDANLVSITPSITISEGATINPSPSSPRNFSQEVEYTVTAEDGIQKVYTVIVNNRILNKENLITLFQLPINGEIVDGDINQEINTITFDLVGADLSSLTPTIEISENATINPSLNTSQNFNEDISYTVTAENGDERTYQIIVNNRPLSTGNDILSFIVGINGEDIEVRINQDTREIAFETGSFNISRLEPEIIISENATITPASGEAVDFTVPVTYTVTAENGETAEYKVQINKAYKIVEGTVLGPRSSGNILFTRAKMTVVTDFLDPNIPEVKLFLTDGMNSVDLPILKVEQFENNRIIRYAIMTEIPENTVTSNNYRVAYQLNDLYIESEVDIDILAEDSPNIISVNQEIYRPGDNLIITGENLTDLIGVPSNGSFYLFNPAGNIDSELNAQKTEYRLTLEGPSSFAYTAFFFYGGETRDIIFIGPNRRLGAQITVNVER
ncbi:MAG: DUF5018 domain-containing protein [Saonia sp.]